MPLKDANILIVDDEVGILRIFKKWFEREGSRVFTAENGLEALELLKIHPIDMLLSDVRMPQMDGIELARRVRQTGSYFPKIIFVSGFSDIDDRECCDLGIEFKLAKPIRREDLVAAVRRCLTARGELWGQPSEVFANNTLSTDLCNIRDAQTQGLISLGYGGVCVHSALSVHVGEMIGLNIGFSADRRAIVGQGVVRWTAREEMQIGIEITYIDDTNRTWFVDLAEREGAPSFIPRDTSMAFKKLLALGSVDQSNGN